MCDLKIYAGGAGLRRIHHNRSRGPRCRAAHDCASHTAHCGPNWSTYNGSGHCAPGCSRQSTVVIGGSYWSSGKKGVPASAITDSLIGKLLFAEERGGRCDERVLKRRPIASFPVAATVAMSAKGRLLWPSACTPLREDWLKKARLTATSSTNCVRASPLNISTIRGCRSADCMVARIRRFDLVQPCFQALDWTVAFR